MTDGHTLAHVDDVTSVREAPRASRPSRSRSFPWAAAPSHDAAEIAQARRRWYGGAVFGLLWQSLLLIALWTDGGSFRDHLTATASLALVYAFFMVAPELMWRRALVGRVVVVGFFALCSGLLLAVLGPLAVWSWLLLVSLSGFVAARLWVSMAVTGLTVAGQLAVAAVVGWDTASASGILFAPLITISVGASMVFFGRQREAEDRLGVAQDEITRLAVVEERARFSRDLHDVLGHSLTVVTMKSELAARLVDTDPVRAKAEMQDVERLAREALQGLRQAVSGYREASLDAELLSARAALSAAQIAAELPASGDAAAADARSLFAWVLREGVTNVLRHAGASAVRITISRTALTVEDDGTGSLDGPVVGTPVFGGNGLRGLRERADAVGATLATGTSDLGGFLLRVERGRQ